MFTFTNKNQKTQKQRKIKVMRFDSPNINENCFYMESNKYVFIPKWINIFWEGFSVTDMIASSITVIIITYETTKI